MIDCFLNFFLSFGMLYGILLPAPPNWCTTTILSLTFQLIYVTGVGVTPIGWDSLGKFSNLLVVNVPLLCKILPTYPTTTARGAGPCGGVLPTWQWSSYITKPPETLRSALRHDRDRRTNNISVWKIVIFLWLHFQRNPHQTVLITILQVVI